MVENWRMLENHFVHARIVNRRKFLRKCGTCQNTYIGTNYLNKHFRLLHETFGKCRKVSESVWRCRKSPRLVVTCFFQDCTLWLNYHKLGLRCLVVYLMDGAANPTMDLWFLIQSHLYWFGCFSGNLCGTLFQSLFEEEFKWKGLSLDHEEVNQRCFYLID